MTGFMLTFAPISRGRITLQPGVMMLNDSSCWRKLTADGKQYHLFSDGASRLSPTESSLFRSLESFLEVYEFPACGQCLAGFLAGGREREL